VHNVRDEKLLLKFGKNLARVRRARGLTQEDVAYESGLTLSQIARIETGRLNTTISTVAVLLKTLKCEANELFK
jgi:transcriptional regulator with XRE-family HTH domain